MGEFLTPARIRQGVRDLKRIRERVRFESVHKAWTHVTNPWMGSRASRSNAARTMLLRHVIPGVPPFYNREHHQLALVDADRISTAHALKWVDTVIAYAEEHGK